MQVKRLKAKTMQGLFNIAVRGLHKQGYRRSLSGTRTFLVNPSAYRGKDGMKCALGHCISDAEYNPALETTPTREILPEGLNDEATGAWACGLQGCHDLSESPQAMRLALLAFATEHGLDWPAGVPKPRKPKALAP